jgi:hypothetical protein
MRKIYWIGLSLLLLGVMGYEYLRGPTPVEELLPTEAEIDLQAYDGSMPVSGSLPLDDQLFPKIRDF